MEYRWIISLEFSSFNWSEKGEQWLSQLSRTAEEVFGGCVNLRAEGRNELQRIEAELTASDAAMDARLIVDLQSDKNPEFMLAGNSDSPNDREVAIWKEIAEKAKVDMGRARHQFPWAAIIGQTPSFPAGGESILLDHSGKVSSLRITPSGKRLREAHPCPGLLGRFTASESNLIVVRSKSEAHDWWKARELASTELSKLAGILSVAWGVCVGIRQLPVPLEIEQLEIPDEIPGIFGDAIPEKNAGVGEHDRKVSLPSWVQGAWHVVGKSKKVHAAVSMYMEGQRIEEQHPSMSLVAFTSAIEAVSLEIFSVDKNKEIAAAFRETLKLAVGTEIAGNISSAYGRRSLTVHKGRLHGNEFMPGAFPISFTTPPSREFSIILGLMHDASRRLLLRVLRGEISAEKRRKGKLTEPDHVPFQPSTASVGITG
ncbi:hypothetical protein [Streptomyces geranii]|uniref:hypothetical protein n=1 Tax=Streptomyces geranii TaxID=2058923 RepID=UPI0013003EC6|nr:hypothetical protein [Streptomyces geranii]